MQMFHRGSYCGYLCRASAESVAVIFFLVGSVKDFLDLDNQKVNSKSQQRDKQESINHESLPTWHARNSSRKRPKNLSGNLVHFY